MKTVTLILLLAAAACSGCAEVKPWERNILAKDGMQLVPDETGNYMDEHVYFSKEASKGGTGVGGGGCGCN